MDKNKRAYVALAVACVVNLVAHLCLYPALPEVVATHWGIDGTVDGWSPKRMTLLLDAMPLILLGIMLVCPRIDPRGAAYQKFGGLWRVFVAVVVLFVAVVSWFTELSAFGVVADGSNAVGIFVSAAIGAGLVALGNYLPRARQNYTFGVKTPWGLDDEVVWDRTQRMGGITMIAIGVVFLACAVALALGVTALGTWAIVVTLAGVAWMYVYSYLVWRSRKQA